MNITLGLSCSKGWFSNIIKFIGKSKVSHAWLGYNCEFFGASIFHANRKGLHPERRESFLKHSIIYSEYKVNHPNAENALKELGKYMDEEYDLIAMFHAGWHTVLKRWLKIEPERRKSSTMNAMMCSETLCWYLIFLDKKRFGELEPEIVAPWDIEDIFKSNPDLFEKIMDEV